MDVDNASPASARIKNGLFTPGASQWFTVPEGKVRCEISVYPLRGPADRIKSAKNRPVSSGEMRAFGRGGNYFHARRPGPSFRERMVREIA